MWIEDLSMWRNNSWFIIWWWKFICDSIIADKGVLMPIKLLLEAGAIEAWHGMAVELLCTPLTTSRVFFANCSCPIFLYKFNAAKMLPFSHLFRPEPGLFLSTISCVKTHGKAVTSLQTFLCYSFITIIL